MNVSILSCKAINRSLTQGSTSIRRFIQWQMVGAGAAVKSWYLWEAGAVKSWFVDCQWQRICYICAGVSWQNVNTLKWSGEADIVHQWSLRLIAESWSRSFTVVIDTGICCFICVYHTKYALPDLLGMCRECFSSWGFSFFVSLFNHWDVVFLTKCCLKNEWALLPGILKSSFNRYNFHLDIYFVTVLSNWEIS